MAATIQATLDDQTEIDFLFLKGVNACKSNSQAITLLVKEAAERKRAELSNKQ